MRARIGNTVVHDGIARVSDTSGEGRPDGCELFLLCVAQLFEADDQLRAGRMPSELRPGLPLDAGTFGLMNAASHPK